MNPQLEYDFPRETANGGTRFPVCDNCGRPIARNRGEAAFLWHHTGAHEDALCDGFCDEKEGGDES